MPSAGFAAIAHSRFLALPIPNVRSSVANRDKADKICSMRVLRILTEGAKVSDHVAPLIGAREGAEVVALRG